MAGFEEQYLELLAQVWHEGAPSDDRTGVGTKSVFGATIRADLKEASIPLLTTKRVFWKTAAREMLWFLSGGTNIRDLVKNDVKIWTAWPLDKYRRETGHDISQKDFEARIIADEEFAVKWGELGPVYGKQWVDWPQYDKMGGGLYRRREKGINQIALLVESLRDNPGSRRHIFEGWNVAELDQMALPPCHKSYQFYVNDGRLSGLLYQRSCDLGLGFAFNIFSAGLLVHMLAQQTGYEPGEIIWNGGDVHIYNNHAHLVTEQLARKASGNPRLAFARKPASIFDYYIEDIHILDYHPQNAIRAPVAV